jgi:hypothetical protein
MNKARRGVALVLALAVVLVGGVIIALTFDFIFRFSWTSTEQRGIYVDHTTALSVIQAKIAQIVEFNISQDKTMHVLALGYDSGVTPEAGSLKLADLRFDEWSESEEMPSGTGVQLVVTEVYDMHFMPDWVDYDHSSPDEMRDFPSVFNLAGDVALGGDSPYGDHKSKESGASISEDIGELDPDRYGASLIRVRLYDHRGKLIRTAEEAFVQILPKS